MEVKDHSLYYRLDHKMKSRWNFNQSRVMMSKSLVQLVSHKRKKIRLKLKRLIIIHFKVNKSMVMFKRYYNHFLVEILISTLILVGIVTVMMMSLYSYPSSPACFPAGQKSGRRARPVRRRTRRRAPGRSHRYRFPFAASGAPGLIPGCW